MALALYEPGLGYYASGSRKFGAHAASGSDFVTAPELSPLFGRALARAGGAGAGGQRQADESGSSAPARARWRAQLLDALGDRVRRYTIVDLSAALRERQPQRLAALRRPRALARRAARALHGVVVGNEVLDAMPVQLLHWDGAALVRARRGRTRATACAWADRPTALRPPVDGPFVPGTVTEIHPQAEAFVRTLAERLQRGAAFFIDYGFPEAEYYHPQRIGGTLMCHRAHRADADPLADVGAKDITAHVNFTGIALAAQDAGLEVLGYTSQARFLINCGLLELLQGADAAHHGRSAEADQRARDGRAVQGDRPGPRRASFDAARLRAPATARTRCARDALAARLPARLPGVQRPAGLAAQHRPGPAAGRLQLPPGGRDWYVPLASSWCSACWRC